MKENNKNNNNVKFRIILLFYHPALLLCFVIPLKTLPTTNFSYRFEKCGASVLSSWNSRSPVSYDETGQRYAQQMKWCLGCKEPRLSMETKSVFEKEFDASLSNPEAPNLKNCIDLLRAHPEIEINDERFLNIFRAIELRTRGAQENSGNEEGIFPVTSTARMEMSKMYDLLKELEHLELYGAASTDNYLVQGEKLVSKDVLEEITAMDMKALTPKPTNTLLIFGVLFGLIELAISAYTGIDYNIFVFATIWIGILDNVLVNGAIFETVQRWLMPWLNKKICRHEAGHFLMAYLLGCPVEGCVLSAWSALQDERFDGRRTGVSAGTSFFDPMLSQQINSGLQNIGSQNQNQIIASTNNPLTRSSIDRYSIIVMGGIAAEAIHYGQADGGASDEQALIQLLTQISPRGGRASPWTSESIRNQARWAAMQAVVLLRYYAPSYEALVDTLGKGGDLAECVYAIEKAARDSNTTIADRPLYLLGGDQEWTKDDDQIERYVQSQARAGRMITSNRSVRKLETKDKLQNAVLNSTKTALIYANSTEYENNLILLRSLKKEAEKKLESIEMKLE